MTLELAVADVLEKLAAYMEADAAEKQAAHDAKQKELVAEVQHKIAETTGEHLDSEIVDKLAKADPDILQTLGKVADSNDVSELGTPSTRKTASAPMSKDEAAEAAGDSLVNFCVS